MTEEELNEAIRAWTPRGGAEAGSDDLLQLTHQLTAAAKPTGWIQARDAMRHLYCYLGWLAARGEPLEPTTCFDSKLLAAHLNERYPKEPGRQVTREHASRALGHLAPGVGFSRRIPSERRLRGDGGAALEAASAQEPLSSAVEAVLSSYVPERLASDRWERVAELTREIVRRSAPTADVRARYLVRLVSYLAAWCDHTELPLRIDVVLSAGSIEDFLDWRSKARKPPELRGLATYSSYLHGLRESFDLPLDVPRRPYARLSAGAAYDAFEVKRFYKFAAALRDPGRRRFCRAALDLAFGAGARSFEGGLVRPCDVFTDERGVVVRLHAPETSSADRDAMDALPIEELYAASRVREVVALPEYAARLLAARDAAVAAGDTWLVGGSESKRRHRWKTVLRGRGVTTRVDVSSARAVRTWRVAWLTAIAESIGGYRVLRILMADTDIAALVDEQFAGEIAAEGVAADIQLDDDLVGGTELDEEAA